MKRRGPEYQGEVLSRRKKGSATGTRLLKNPKAVVRRYSEKKLSQTFRKIHRKTHVPEPLFSVKLPLLTIFQS